MTDRKKLDNLLRNHVLVLDGAMGTMVQGRNLSDADFRGERFAGHPSRLEGCNDILCITRPDVVLDIHREYLEAGADIISTDTFNANAISLADYSLHEDSEVIREINRSGAALARKAADEAPDRSWGGKALVAGSVGPTNKSATMSPDITDPAARNVTFDMLFDAYTVQCEGLIAGGVDLILFETVFDTLNLKAGLDAARHAMLLCGREVPVMVSATVSDRSGRTLSGQTLAAFATSVEKYPYIVSLGLNCSFGPEDIIPAVRELGKYTSHFITAHPNAGLPDALGRYSVSPEIFTAQLRPLLDERLVNVVGGCCGTTPAHIKALRIAVDEASPRITESLAPALRISGLEMVEVRPENNFLVVGERCNVAGSRKFLRLIKEKKYDEALAIARKQVEDGAMVIDINMDDPLLDAAVEMKHFLCLYASEPEVAKCPVMVDSSDWLVVETALKNLQGKSVVNSISLKEGEAEFLRKATRIRELGAAVIVMAFDEAGQADTYARKIDVCARAYRLLTEKCGFDGDDIIFDVNVMAVATGLHEHSRYGIDFIDAVRWVKRNLPGARTSGGISNLSFAFRGNNTLREMMHSVFLYHAIAAGLDMAIMNPASALSYDAIDPHLRGLIEDVVLARRPDAADEIADYAASLAQEGAKTDAGVLQRDLSVPVEVRIEEMVVAGKSEHLHEDLDLLARNMKAVDIVEGPLMAGMTRVGKLFGEGKMFLPQVVKTARVMKMAVDHLKPLLMQQSSGAGEVKTGTVLLATVKGDVHDIGKNIVSIVMACNNFEIIDLGVMVPAEDIVKVALERNPDVICLSGLITPSLAEMTNTVRALRKAGVSVPVIVGGATTSALHTALKIAPEYDGAVIHVKDASQNPLVAASLLAVDSADDYVKDVKMRQEELRKEYSEESAGLLSLAEARKRGKLYKVSSPSPAPCCGVGDLILRPFSISELEPLINWKMLLHAWGLHANDCPCGCGAGYEAESLLADARRCLAELSESGRFDGYGMFRILPASADGDDLTLGGKRIPLLRRQSATLPCISLADYVAEGDDYDYAGVFMAGTGYYIDDLRRKYEEAGDSYKALLLQALADRLAEAASEYLHYLVRTQYWGYAPDEAFDAREILRGGYGGIRPAMGYPMLPDQVLNHEIYDLLQPQSGIRAIITENGAMTPSSTISGLYIAAPEAKYFMVGDIDGEQMADYAGRRNIPVERMKQILNK
ncbi:MAG: methionine synthase [Muribaculaceae bacterium]|nr:methionine synthase [Muribaculaceae bacterium]